jgi:hypothetical protein
LTLQKVALFSFFPLLAILLHRLKALLPLHYKFISQSK